MSFCLEARQPFHFFPLDGGDCKGAGGDIAFRDGEFARGNELHSMVLLQLLTDKNKDGGWWGDYNYPFAMGSELWRLRDLPRLNDEALIDAERYVRDAIEPIVTLGLAQRYDVEVFERDNRLSIDLTFYDFNGRDVFNTTVPWVF